MKAKDVRIILFLSVLSWLIIAAILVWLFSPKPVQAGATGILTTHATMLRPETDDWFNTPPPAAVLIAQGQNPIDDPEIGNPDHLERDCNNLKDNPKGHIDCKCAQHWECGVEHAPTQCRSWCYPKRCHCKQGECG